MNNAIQSCILTTAQMAIADREMIAELKKLGRSGADLMEEAGLSVVREIENLCSGSKVLVLCGPGNNGGDGFVVARHLKKSGWQVEIALLGELKSLTGDAACMAALWDDNVKNLDEINIEGYDVIVDAIFGTGLSQEISGELKNIIDDVNLAEALKIAVDIPSGIKGDTGEILGAAVSADHTVTFCRQKPAHLLYPSKEYCGKIIVTNIGIPDRIVENVNPDIFVNNPGLWQDNVPRFSGDFHKYDKGHAVIVSGNKTHTGAGRLAAMAAQRVGAGLVSVSSPEDALDVQAAHLTSIMIREREQISEDLHNKKFNSWCIGPAAGVNDKTKQEVMSILKSGRKVVLDADAITVFEDNPSELFELTNANGQAVLTPHAGEFVRIFPEFKKLDKISAARKAAIISGSVIIYKGADTVIANPDKKVVISENAPPTLATAGSGDVLAGIVCGLMAQNMNLFEAACAGQWIHSECGNEFGEGLIAEDLISMISRVLKRLK